MKNENKEKWTERFNHDEVVELTEMTPRLELRYRDVLYVDKLDKKLVKALLKINPNQRKEIPNIVCDLCLVIKGVDGKTQYHILQSTLTSDIEACNTFNHPWRIEQDLFNLMFELKLKAYCSYLQNYQEIKFPSDDKLGLGIKTKKYKQIN